MIDRPRNIANDILDAVETATSKWTRQKKSEERHPGMIRYRASRMTKEPRTTQKEAAWEVMEQAYMAASGNGALPASARQIYYQARPKIMAMTDDKELAYGYFSQTLLPNYIDEHGVDWNVVYDARGHFEEPHTHRLIGCGTIEVGNYLHAMKKPRIVPAEFSDANVDVIGPNGGISSVLFCEKEGFAPLFKSVNLANRYDLMIISTKGVSVTAARQLVDNICGYYGLPLFVLHDFDVAGFLILGTLQRDTRRYQFSSAVEVVDLGLRLDDTEGLEREPAAATRTSANIVREQLAENGATDAEIDILIGERVELNAMTSDALIEMIERKLGDYGLEKVIPDDDLLADTYRAFHRSQQLREKFEEMKSKFEENATEIEVPQDLQVRVRAILGEHDDLRWDDAIQIVLDKTQLDRVRADKRKAKKKSGDFTGADDEDGEGDDEDDDDDDDAEVQP
jgi:DNA topoisomerase 6 subunit A-like protein